ncbi:hypothetical protein KIPB_008407 [Kipferlia bialata]|uniref:Uncharacterized protein n=1 Tax=Kipferlia bialata TaxID=797122 RepID=A0A9K3GJU2_9EUKA|nr:hypothetical protein KIPB_008407 [Kipferlia bialata]|eukprot:g8407.t1
MQLLSTQYRLKRDAGGSGLYLEGFNDILEDTPPEYAVSPPHSPGNHHRVRQRDTRLAGGVEIPPGLTVECVLGDYLRGMVGQVLSVMDTRHQGEVTLANVQWCIVVPSEATDQTRSRMRQAACLAGMIPEVDSDRLALAPEPIAAALHFTIHCHRYRLYRDEAFIVVDTSEETINLTVHKVTPGGNELQLASECAAPGCSLADREFLQYVRGCIGAEHYDRWLEYYPEELPELISSWRHMKYLVPDAPGDDESSDGIWPDSITVHMPRMMEYVVEEDGGGRDIYDEFEVSRVQMQRLFEPVVEKVLTLIDTHLTALAEQGETQVRALVLTGDLARWDYFVTRVWDRFRHRVRRIFWEILKGRVLMSGAVFYGCPALANFPTREESASETSTDSETESGSESD